MSRREFRKLATKLLQMFGKSPAFLLFFLQKKPFAQSLGAILFCAFFAFPKSSDAVPCFDLEVISLRATFENIPGNSDSRSTGLSAAKPEFQMTGDPFVEQIRSALNQLSLRTKTEARRMLRELLFRTLKRPDFDEMATRIHNTSDDDTLPVAYRILKQLDRLNALPGSNTTRRNRSLSMMKDQIHNRYPQKSFVLKPENVHSTFSASAFLKSLETSQSEFANPPDSYTKHKVVQNVAPWIPALIAELRLSSVNLRQQRESVHVLGQLLFFVIHFGGDLNPVSRNQILAAAKDLRSRLNPYTQQVSQLIQDDRLSMIPPVTVVLNEAQNPFGIYRLEALQVAFELESFLLRLFELEQP